MQGWPRHGRLQPSLPYRSVWWSNQIKSHASRQGISCAGGYFSWGTADRVLTQNLQTSWQIVLLGHIWLASFYLPMCRLVYISLCITPTPACI